MLDGDIQVFHDLVVACDLVDQLIVKLVGVEVMEPDPANPLDCGKLPAQLGQTAFPVQVRAVASDILGNHDQLLHAVLRQILRLRHHVFQTAGAVVSANVGDGAEGAEVVAALGNTQIGPAGTGGNHPGDLFHRGVPISEEACLPACQHCIRGFYDIAEASHAQYRVDFRQLLQDRVLVALGQTAADDQAAQLSCLFQLRHLQNSVNGLALCRVDKAAGVDDYRVSLGRVVYKLKALLL